MANTGRQTSTTIADKTGSALAPEIYAELRAIAHAQLKRQHRDATLSTTALVNEAYVKLGANRQRWRDEHHFFATMARIMRQVAVDLARRKAAIKRDPGIRVEFDQLEDGQIAEYQSSDLIEIDLALDKLGEMDPRLEHVMELRFFAGMTIPEVASMLGVSEPTVVRDVRTARTFLTAELSA